MGETKTPSYPRPQDLDSRVYAAFMGHAPQVRPPEERGLDAWQKWPVLRDLKSPKWERLRRMCSDSVLSPRVRDRMAPLVAQARKRWTEARERLGKQVERAQEHVPGAAQSESRRNWSLK
ncbi:MAG TPA: hypothetical protein VGI81_23220 [Tepidisphaeraceae bacterium]|jgi:hypothetical protein